MHRNSAGKNPPSARRILFVNHVGATEGGAETSLLELMSTLDRNRYVPILAAPGHSALANAAMHAEINVFPLNMLRVRRGLRRMPRMFFSLLRTVPGLTKLIRSEQIDVVHANSNMAQVYAAFAAHRARVPLVWHSRDLVDLGKPGCFLAQRSAGIIGISQCVTRHLRQYCDDESRLHTILNGINTQRFVSAADERATFRNRVSIPNSAVVIGMVGHYVPWKNHALFLATAARVAEANPALHFIVVGGDPFGDLSSHEADLQGLARQSGIIDRVTFTGVMANIIPALDAMDILVHPAKREPFGRVLVEAMCRAKPIVAVNACGPAEIVRDGVDGRLVPADDPAALADALEALIHDAHERRRMGEKARAHAIAAFDVTRVGNEVQALYDTILEGYPYHNADRN